MSGSRLTWGSSVCRGCNSKNGNRGKDLLLENSRALFIAVSLTFIPRTRNGFCATSRPEYSSARKLLQWIGFGHVVLSRMCWSSDGCVSMCEHRNIDRGVWAGHSFDIITETQHLEETRRTQEQEWKDVSEEVAQEIAIIWEYEYGKNWRDEIMRR